MATAIDKPLTKINAPAGGPLSVPLAVPIMVQARMALTYQSPGRKSVEYKREGDVFELRDDKHFNPKTMARLTPADLADLPPPVRAEMPLTTGGQRVANGNPFTPDAGLGQVGPALPLTTGKSAPNPFR